MTPRIVVMGASLGGFDALKAVLGGLPERYPLPLAIVQHRAIGLEGELCAQLQRYCSLPVREPEDKEQAAPAHVYIAPADYHLLVESGSFALSTEAPVAFARPSVDVLFETAADAYGEGVVGVILTGTNRDGARGMVYIKEHGGYTIVQDPQSAERGELPAAVLALLTPDLCLELGAIAPALVELGMAARR